MTDYRFFIGISDADALKSEYRRLMMKYHPDKGHYHIYAQQLNVEYAARMKAISSGDQAYRIYADNDQFYTEGESHVDDLIKNDKALVERLKNTRNSGFYDDFFSDVYDAKPYGVEEFDLHGQSWRHDSTLFDPYWFNRRKKDKYACYMYESLSRCPDDTRRRSPVWIAAFPFVQKTTETFMRGGGEIIEFTIPANVVHQLGFDPNIDSIVISNREGIIESEKYGGVGDYDDPYTMCGRYLIRYGDIDIVEVNEDDRSILVSIDFKTQHMLTVMAGRILCRFQFDPYGNVTSTAKIKILNYRACGLNDDPELVESIVNAIVESSNYESEIRPSILFAHETIDDIFSHDALAKIDDKSLSIVHEKFGDYEITATADEICGNIEYDTERHCKQMIHANIRSLPDKRLSRDCSGRVNDIDHKEF